MNKLYTYSQIKCRKKVKPRTFKTFLYSIQNETTTFAKEQVTHKNKHVQKHAKGRGKKSFFSFKGANGKHSDY